MTCEQAQKNADAIVKYPTALRAIGERDEAIRLKENEISHIRAGFNLERKMFALDKTTLTDSYDKEVRRKKRWRIVSGVLVIVATAFYVK